MLAIGLTSCSHSTADRSAPTKEHVAQPPHGGTAIAAGDDYRIEFLYDPDGGTLTAYVLDDEMEEFIRIPAPSLDLSVRDDHGQPRNLSLHAASSPATGETVGNTSEFDGQAAWLKGLPSVRGTLTSITIRGSTFQNLPVTVPATHDPR